MVNPTTGNTVMVSTHSWGYGAAGIAAAIGAQQAQKSKVETMKGAGWVEIENLAVVGINVPKELDAKPKVLMVNPGSPADLAGMRPGDILLASNDIKVDTVGALHSIPRYKIGDDVEYKVFRDGKELTFKMKAVSAASLIKK
jgi:S1-C subfamily serine protease